MTFTKKKASVEEFIRATDDAVSIFETNNLLKEIQEGRMSLTVYHNFLKMIFNQTYFAGPTFALAGANCCLEYPLISNYLIHHASEEKDHWKWVLEDLSNSGYVGADPRQEFPPFECQAYISFNTFLSIQFPIARLGTAALLENVGARNGKKFAQIIASQLNLKATQLKFLFGHGDTDVKHSLEIIEVLKQSHLSEEAWGWLCFATSTAGVLYKNMFDEVVG